MSDSLSITLQGDLLRVGNSLFEQRWQLAGASPRLVSFVSAKSGTEWVKAPAAAEASAVAPELTLTRGQRYPSEAVSLRGLVRLPQPCGAVREYEFQVFEGLCGSLVGQTLEDRDAAAAIAASATGGDAGVALGGIEQDPPVAAGGTAATQTDATGGFAPVLLARPHLELSQVMFVEQSDEHSNYVFERRLQVHPSERAFGVTENLLTFADPANGGGLGLLLLAPSHLVRAQWDGGPVYEVQSLPALNTGCGPLASVSLYPRDYPLAILVWEGGQVGRTGALHQLQRVLHSWDRDRDGLLLSNTWGDRGRGERLCEAFACEEVRLAKQLGVDVVQLDDGWQQGRTANTITGQSGVWSGFWNSALDFWNVNHTAFPSGFEPVVRAASTAGMKLGLWFAPDSVDDFANWEKDAALLLQLWRQYGVCHFKLDAIKLHTRTAERRLYLLLERVHRGSNGEVLFDLDLTAEYRLSYWGQLQGSTLFLQNRYTDWTNYYPHQTLRALWELSAYVLPSRVRLEVLNPERNDERYGSDPLRPSAYPADYLLAITLPASGLGWFEHQGLSEAVRTSWSRLLAAWKPHRDAWHAGDVLRVGALPNGFSWTGFVSLGADGFYALVFRERNPEGKAVFPLAEAAAAGGTVSVIAGEGSAVYAGGVFEVEIPAEQRFVLLRVTF